jgi:hypothetical protein
MPTVVNFRRKNAESEQWSNEYFKMDEEIARAFGEEPHETRWFRNWYNTIVFAFAMGHTYESLRTEVYKDDPETLEVLTWLEEHLEFSTHREFGRRE